MLTPCANIDMFNCTMQESTQLSWSHSCRTNFDPVMKVFRSWRNRCTGRRIKSLTMTRRSRQSSWHRSSPSLTRWLNWQIITCDKSCARYFLRNANTWIIICRSKATALTLNANLSQSEIPTWKWNGSSTAALWSQVCCALLLCHLKSLLLTYI